MGYKRNSTKFQLKFENEEYNGLEVTVKSIPLKKMLELEGIFAEDKTPSKDEIIQAFDVFAGALVQWNLEDENDQPVPTTLAGILDQDMEFVLEIIAAWMEAITSVSSDLGKGSTSGVNSAEVLIPMETL